MPLSWLQPCYISPAFSLLTNLDGLSWICPHFPKASSPKQTLDTVPNISLAEVPALWEAPPNSLSLLGCPWLHMVLTLLCSGHHTSLMVFGWWLQGVTGSTEACLGLLRVLVVCICPQPTIFMWEAPRYRQYPLIHQCKPQHVRLPVVPRAPAPFPTRLHSSCHQQQYSWGD